MLITSSTRWVILTPRYAIKLPSFRSWRCFLNGTRANRHEKKCSQHQPSWFRICPVVFALPFGILNVMPRCEHLTHDEWYAEEIKARVKSLIFTYRFFANIENKHDSFGWYRNSAGEKHLVALDYGS